MPSPVRCERHGEPHSTLGGWLFLYRARTRGVRLADNASVRLGLGNMPQPDCLLFISPACGGQVRIDEDDYVNGAPDLVAEVAAGSIHCDLNGKFQAYPREGFCEYMIWRRSSTVRLIGSSLREAGYEKLAPDEDGIFRTRSFPDSGLIRPHCCATIATRCWRCSSMRPGDARTHRFQSRTGTGQVRPSGLTTAVLPRVGVSCRSVWSCRWSGRSVR